MSENELNNRKLIDIPIFTHCLISCFFNHLKIVNGRCITPRTFFKERKHLCFVAKGIIIK